MTLNLEATMNSQTDQEQYSIRELSTITGVNAVTLRAWERRYGLLKPARSGKGHRYYTTADVDTVRNILVWLDRGLAISKVRPLLGSELPAAGGQQVVDDHWQATIGLALERVGRFQRDKLEQQLNELFGNYPLDTLNANFFRPLLATLERAAALRFGARAEKLFFDSELHADLMSRIRHANSNNHGLPLLLIAFDSEQQGIQALLLALALLEAGFRLHLLSGACSLREIPYIIEQSQLSPGCAIRAVICHSDSRFDIAQPEQELARAASHARVPFFVSGECLSIMPALRAADGVTALAASLRAAVGSVGEALQDSPPVRGGQP